MAPGHVFLLRGNLRLLKCDAIGVSGDSKNKPSKNWRDFVHGIEHDASPARVDAARFVRRGDILPGGVIPYVVPIAGTTTTPVAWYLDALRVFLERASREATSPERPHPKLAIPLLGGGDGGKRNVRGDLLRAILETLLAFTQRHAVDVVLVLGSAQAFDGAQSLRRALGEAAWTSLERPLLDQADRLADRASRGELALFLGAGVSMAAGLPSWWDLLGSIAAPTLSDQEKEQTKRLSALDYAQLLARRLGPGVLQQLVVDQIRTCSLHALAHGLLASLPVIEVVTTNYDKLFEVASEATERRAHLIPYEGPPTRGRRWLLKLHGCVDHPDDIVLSRKTFLQYEASRAALAGLLAGVLITRHVLFVGSSFSDDNVLRIAEEVQRLGMEVPERRGQQEPQLGTNLAIGTSPLLMEMWQGDVDSIELGQNPVEGSRMLEIFLDRMVASSTTGAAFLFDRTLEGLLGEEDRQLRDALDAFVEKTKTLSHPAVRAHLKQLRERFGWKASD